MNLRNYPLTEADFKREIEPYIVSHKNRLGRPSKVSFYNFFCAVWYVMRNFYMPEDFMRPSGKREAMKSRGSQSFLFRSD